MTNIMHNIFHLTNNFFILFVLVFQIVNYCNSMIITYNIKFDLSFFIILFHYNVPTNEVITDSVMILHPPGRVYTFLSGSIEVDPGEFTYFL